MAPPHSDIPKAAQPKYGRNFDPWNSVALGHQRAETRGPNGWRENRTWKLHSQLGAGNGGGRRLPDAVGAGAEEDYEEGTHGMLVPKKAVAAAAAAAKRKTVVDMLRRPGTMETTSVRRGGGGSKQKQSPNQKDPDQQSPGDDITMKIEKEDEGEQGQSECQEGGSTSAIASTIASTSKKPPTTTKIFDGLVIYINGSTHPLISDHKLKHLLVENGARMSIHLGRRQVSHVILGRPSTSPSASTSGAGAGGGLAGGKLEREIRRVGGCGVKYVGVEWVLESLKAGRRLPEARFGTLKVAARGQPSVYGVFSSSSSSKT